MSLTTLNERRAPSLRDRRSPWVKVSDWLLARPRDINPPATVPMSEPQADRVGICCSGGGVRSAAYNLGALQVLREEGFFKPDAYVSAVSGGSYIAAAHAALATESERRDGEKPVFGPGSPEEQHLRNHCSYLAPGLGGKARLLGTVLLGLLMNLVLIFAAVGLTAIPIGWLAHEAYPQLANPHDTGALHLDPWMWLVPLLAVAVGVALSIPDLLAELPSGKEPVGDERRWRWLWAVINRRFRETWSARLIVLGVASAVLLIAVPQVLLWAREVTGVSPGEIVNATNLSSDAATPSDPAGDASGFFQVINLGAILTAALGALRALIARKPGFFVVLAGAIAGPLALIAPALWIVNDSAANPIPETSTWFGICAVVLILIWLIADLAQWSLYPYYRRRLHSAFFLRRTDQRDGPLESERGVEELPDDFSPKLSELHYESDDLPKLIVCAAANISDEGVTPPGRWASLFSFSRQEIGGPLIGVLPSHEYEADAERAQRRIGLPSAVAMSGAAVSPVMGKKTKRAVSFLLALTNVRLGVWVPNPRWVNSLDTPRFEKVAPLLEGASNLARSATTTVTPGRYEDQVTGAFEVALRWLTRRRASPKYLFKELFGRTSVEDRFIYVTDGGHYDNLGLIELLTRGCTTIFCLDAGGDPSGKYTALGEAVALARSELQVDVEIDPEPIKPDEKTGISERDFVTGRFRFRATKRREQAASKFEDEETNSDWIGDLIYCRAAVTRDAPWDVRAFKDRDPRFPNHSTLDQLFNDEKFEAYRALGAHTAQSAVLGWTREIALEEVHKVLRETARARLTITEEKLFERVRDKVGNTDTIDFRPLLREIANHDEAAERPPLPLVVQKSDPPPDDVYVELVAVWNYWASGPDGQKRVTADTEPTPPIQPPRASWLIRIRRRIPLIR